MPRPKSNKNLSPFHDAEPEEQIRIHQRIAGAAHTFAQEILHILGSSTMLELQALASDGDSRRGRPGASNGGRFQEEQDPPRRKPSKRSLCLAPDCDRPGIRSRMNFCMEHATSIPRQEQLRLREAQLLADLPPPPSSLDRSFAGEHQRQGRNGEAMRPDNGRKGKKGDRPQR